MTVRKVGVFVEGQAELIFLRNILFHLFDPNLISFECLHLRAGSHDQVPFEYLNKDASIHFFILNVENDEKVLSYIKENEKNYFSKGYERLIGLRDLYCETYHKLSGGKIDSEVNDTIINACKDIVDGMEHSDSVSLLFSVMELESWWLSMPSIFPKLNPRLTVESIHENLGIDLSQDDIETVVYKSSVFLDKIMSITGGSYSKKLGEVESITSRITKDDIDYCVNNGCQSFADFHQELTGLI